jgi:hypothetical protein
VRLLPGVTLRVVELLRPALGVAETVLVRMRRLRGGRSANQRSRRNYEQANVRQNELQGSSAEL